MHKDDGFEFDAAKSRVRPRERYFPRTPRAVRLRQMRPPPAARLMATTVRFHFRLQLDVRDIDHRAASAD